jgi:hypothetical protein
LKKQSNESRKNYEKSLHQSYDYYFGGRINDSRHSLSYEQFAVHLQFAEYKLSQQNLRLSGNHAWFEPGDCIDNRLTNQVPISQVVINKEY